MVSFVVTSIDGIRALRDEWEPLAPLSGIPMLDHHWMVSCAEALHEERNLRLVVTRARGSLTGVAPLALEAGGPGRHLVLLGGSRLYEPGGWLFSSEAALAELTAAVIDLSAPLLLHRVPSDSRLAGALVALPRNRGVTVKRRASPSLAVNTSTTWSGYYSSLSRRTLRKFSDGLVTAERALGPAHIEQLQPCPADVGPLLEMFAELEHSGWKGRQGSSIRQRQDLARFLEVYCRRAAERRELRIMKLSFGSQVAAAEISLDAHGRRWGLKIAYRESLAVHSPGLQLVHASIRAAFEGGMKSYEFLGSAEDWQRRWRPETREYQMILTYPLSLPGLIGACRDAGTALWRRAARRRERLNN
jgi:CelD/BcsL family acetyltransferase involved in cellulose biosynthesis